MLSTIYALRSETIDTDGDCIGSNADTMMVTISVTLGTLPGADPLDADSYPDVGGLKLLMIKTAIDASNTIRN